MIISLNEINQFLLVMSITYILYVIVSLLIRLYSRFYLKTDTRYTMYRSDKIALLLSLSYILTQIV